MTQTIMPTYRRLPVEFVKGQGSWLWDTVGQKYLDALTGIAVCGLGHAHPKIADAICEQAKTLLHTSNLYEIGPQQALADKLTSLSGMQHVFFGNSGAEANEATLKVARLYGNKKGIKNPTVIVTDKSFHGRTIATLSATGNRKVQAGFEPLVSGFRRVPYNDIEAIEAIAKTATNVVAIMVEPVLGEAGVHIPDDDYLTNIRRICDENGWLMMLDEIQTGIARTGKMFAFQHADITPDVMSLAKGLGNGVPIGACLVNGPAADVLGPGNHGSTFGGNFLSTRTALTVLEIIEEQQLVARAASLGESITQKLETAFADLPLVSSVRHKGMMLGIELSQACPNLVEYALDHLLLINCPSETIIRLLPPLTLSDEEADILVTRLYNVLSSYTPA
ncbi:MAG: aspartate aminotransferase family protein [Methylococcales bacterium]|nr:aspartate aminotransferase family protein [Methylococcales bacterium]